MSIKVIIGLILIVVSFIYLIKNPGQSMMDGMMKKSEKNFEKAKAKAEAESAELAETEETNEDA